VNWQPLNPQAVKELVASYPKCRWCRKPCVGGQVDGEGVPSHYCCSLAFLLRRKRHPREAPLNPQLPQLQHISQLTDHPGTRPGPRKGNQPWATALTWGQRLIDVAAKVETP
jgi:hypothetical protein